jgi:PAS domain S-box-containing protein
VSQSFPGKLDFLQLPHASDRFEQLAQNAPVAIFIKDLQGRYTLANPLACEALGRPDVIGLRDDELLDTASAERIRRHDLEVIESRRSVEYEERVQRGEFFQDYLAVKFPLLGDQGDVEGVCGVAVDITLQHRADSELALLAAIVSSSDDAIISMSLEGTITSWNRGGEKLFGYTAEEAIGKSVTMILPAERSDEEHRILARIRSGERLEHFETVRVSKEGKRIDVSLTVSPILNTLGQIIGASKVSRDISDRIQAAQAVRESEQRFRILANHAPVGIFQTNLSGETTFVNNAWCQLAGLELTYATGDGWINAVHPADRERVIHDWHVACDAGLPSRTEFRFRRPDGGVVWLQGNAEPLRDRQGNLIGYIGTVADITARKIAEQALSDNERRLAAELANMNRLYELTARLLATENLEIALNEVLFAAIELQNADFGAVHILDNITGEFRIAAQRGFDQKLLDRFIRRELDSCSACGRAFRSGTRAIIEDVERDSDYADFLPFAREAGYRTIQSTPLTSRGGKMLGLLSTHFRTPRKFAGRELRMLDLYARQAADFIEQIQMINAMREADHRKDEFLAMLSHELRNPLAPIRSGLDCLATDNSQVGEVVDIMRDQVEHLVRLVDDLLDMSRIARGKIELRKEIVTATTLVDRAVDSIAWAFKAKHQSLEVKIPTEGLSLKADPVRLVQVLGNLLNNASKYTPEGGHIELSVGRRDDQVAFQVVDNGIGIERELLPRVFDLFTQSTRALDRAQGGMGIGLTLVRRLVELHEGSVSAESDGIGRGSRFTIKLPVCEQLPTYKSKPAHSINDGRRILVVDDNYGAARLLTILLKKLGNHEVEVAYDGPAALDQLTVFGPEIVFLDIGLPGIDGYEVGRKMREIAGDEPLLLVALTGYGRPEDISESKAAGFDEHLVKPPSMEMLQAVLVHPQLRNSVASGS